MRKSALLLQQRGEECELVGRRRRLSGFRVPIVAVTAACAGKARMPQNRARADELRTGVDRAIGALDGRRRFAAPRSLRLCVT